MEDDIPEISNCIDIFIRFHGLSNIYLYTQEFMSELCSTCVFKIMEIKTFIKM